MTCHLKEIEGEYKKLINKKFKEKDDEKKAKRMKLN
jgi:hypothetical protein